MEWQSSGLNAPTTGNVWCIHSSPSSQAVLGVQLDVEEVVHDYQTARRKLLVFGYNATLTTGVEAQQRQPKRQFEHLMVMHVAVSSVFLPPHLAQAPARTPHAVMLDVERLYLYKTHHVYV